MEGHEKDDHVIRDNPFSKESIPKKRPERIRSDGWERPKGRLPGKTVTEKRPQRRAPLEGMGAVVSPGGVTFRVWAPNADAVAVIGDFNGWGDDYDCLVKGGNGFWALHLDAAKIGDAYKFVIGSGGRKLFKNDPYALEADGKGNSVISDPKFEWRENGFEMADRNALILYQVHVGTFFGDYDQETGRFAQVCEKMRYLKALGINALELVPVSGFPGAAHWGYDPAHLSAIERTYGGGAEGIGRSGRYRPPARHSGDHAGEFRPFRYVGPRAMAVRRRVGKRQGGHLFLQRRTFPYPGGMPGPTTESRRSENISGTTFFCGWKNTAATAYGSRPRGSYAIPRGARKVDGNWRTAYG